MPSFIQIPYHTLLFFWENLHHWQKFYTKPVPPNINCVIMIKIPLEYHHHINHDQLDIVVKSILVNERSYLKSIIIIIKKKQLTTASLVRECLHVNLLVFSLFLNSRTYLPNIFFIILFYYHYHDYRKI